MSHKFLLILQIAMALSFLPSCERTDVTFHDLEKISSTELGKWETRNWVMVAALFSEHAYRGIGTYDPSFASSQLFVSTDGYLSSAAAGQFLDTLAYSQDCLEHPKRPAILKLFRDHGKEPKNLFSPPFPEPIFSLAWSPNERYLAFYSGPKFDFCHF